MSASAWHSQVVPARLAFLALYNPTLGPTDETFPDQLVFWYSPRPTPESRATTGRARSRDNRSEAPSTSKDEEKDAREEENERLRQIGLAQGIVDFAR